MCRLLSGVGVSIYGVGYTNLGNDRKESRKIAVDDGWKHHCTKQSPMPPLNRWFVVCGSFAKNRTSSNISRYLDHEPFSIPSLTEPNSDQTKKHANQHNAYPYIPSQTKPDYILHVSLQFTPSSTSFFPSFPLTTTLLHCSLHFSPRSLHTTTASTDP